MSLGLKPTLWRTCRVLANEMRLDMLRYVISQQRTNVGDVARHFSISGSMASQYLRQLNSRGLIRREKVNAFVFYTPEANRSICSAGYLLAALETSLADHENDNDRLIRILTGFTHPHRLTIMKSIGTGSKTWSDLISSCKMTIPSARRHLNKLIDRGIVEAKGGNGIKTIYRLAKTKDPLLSVLHYINLAPDYHD